jgi:hypothetical protein
MYSSILTIDGAGSAKRLSRSEDLGVVGGICLRNGLVSEIDGGPKSFAIADGAGHIDVVEDGVAGFDDGNRDGWVLGQAVCDD